MQLRRALPAAGLSGLTVALGLPALSWPASSFDELVLLVDPIRMLGGDLPYRDFSTAYGPTHWWLLEGLFGVTGPSVLAARLLGLALHVALVLGVRAWLRPSGSGISTFAAASTALVLFPLGDAPYAWVTALAGSTWGWALLARRESSARQRAAAGLLQVLAIGARPDAALLALVPALPYLTRGRWRPWALGGAVGALPLVVSAALTGGGFVHDVLISRAGRAAAMSRLPLWPDDSNDRRLLVLLAATVLTTVIRALLRRDRRSASLGFVAVLALPQALQRVDTTHLLYAGLLLVPLLVVVLCDLATQLPPPWRSPWPAAGIATGCLLWGGLGHSAVRPIALVLAGKGPPAVTVRHEGRVLPVAPHQAAALEQLLPRLDALAAPGATLFVYDANLTRPAVTDLAVYFLEPRLSQRAHNLDVTPGVSSSPAAQLARDVTEADVIVLVQTPQQVRDELFPHERDGSNAAATALAQGFMKVADVGYYEIWLPRG